MKRHNPSRDLDHLDLFCRKIKNTEEVEKVLKLQKKVFKKIPDRGMLTHTNKTLERSRIEYRKCLKSKNDALYGLFKNKKLVGFFGAFVFIHPLLKQKSGGITLTFDFPIQGKGIAKNAYRIILEHFKSKGVQTFRGGTSQPAVMGLGELMKRRPEAFLWAWNNY